MSKYHYCISDIKKRVFVSKVKNGWSNGTKQDSNGLTYTDSEVKRNYDDVKHLEDKYSFEYQNILARVKHLKDLAK